MELTKKHIIVAGHICLDITPVFPTAGKTSLGELLSPGKLIHMDAAAVSTGGAVANTGLALRKLGADVELMGKVGDDDFGRLILNRLKPWGVDSGMIVSPSASTSYTVVIAPPGVDRIFLHHPGANDTFSCADLDFQRIAEASLFHFGYPPLMRSTYERDGDELVTLFQQVSQLGVATSLDMAAVDPASPAGRADWSRILSRVLPYTDFFVPSVEEIGFMLDRPLYDAWQRRAAGGDITRILDVERDIAPLARRLVALGARVVLLKCGAPGMFCCTADAEALRPLGRRLGLSLDGWASQERFEYSYRPDAVRSGTGAGDTSIAAFLLAALSDCSLPRSLQLCTATGACCVSAYDALSGLLPFDTLLSRIDGGWEKQHLI